MPHNQLFQCPSCATSFESLDDQTRCAGCDRPLEFRDGIPCFTENQDYFFGEIDAHEMRELAHSVQLLGWDVAFEQMCSRQTRAMKDYIQQYIADASRANWKYLLHLPDAGRVLDFGCGWGETTISLSRSVSEIVSMDLTLERLLLLKARVADQGIDHVRFVHGGDALPLPFADQSFDAVVLNGVLEWVPVTGTDDPRECQLAILRELRRTLRPDGQIYIGIENRIGLKYFSGSLDEHSQLKFTSLMPRSIADRYCRWRIGHDYRTYTYSQSGYLKLLQDAGFDHVDFYCPYPDYREFDRIVPVDNSNVSGLYRPLAKWKRALKRLPGFPNLLRITVPSFSIIAGDVSPGESRLARTLAEIGHQIDRSLLPPSGYRSQRTGEILVTCDVEDDNTKALVRIVETEPAIDSRIRSAQFLSTLFAQQDVVNPSMQVIPHSFGHGRVRHLGFTIEEAIEGQTWQQIAALRGNPDGALIEVAQWLLDFQHSTFSGEVWESEQLAVQLRSLVKQVDELLPQVNLNRWRTCNHWLNSSSRLPVVVSHGDLHLGNVLFSPQSNRLAGVIDWDLADFRGFPLVDLAYLFFSQRVVVHQQSFDQAVHSLRMDGTKTRCEVEIIEKYLDAFDLEHRDWITAVEFAVLINVATLSRRRPHAFERIKSEMAATVQGFSGDDRSDSIPILAPDPFKTARESDIRRSSA